MRVALLILLLSLQLTAKPMEPASLQQGKAQSQAIVLAEYLGYTAPRPVEYFQPPLARYRVIKVLKGQVNPEVQVAYAFHDGSACLAPTDFRFTAGMLPARGSRWVLLLQSATDGVWSTYRGDFGRRKADELPAIQKLSWRGDAAQSRGATPR